VRPWEGAPGSARSDIIGPRGTGLKTMGIHDRPYMQSGWQPPGGGTGGFTFGLPRPGRAVKVLLAINIAVFLIQIFDRTGAMERLFGVKVSQFWQFWRYLTFQFLHSVGSFWHILLNMLGLYILGSLLERHYGTRRFLTFYLSCGAAAGVSYVIIGAASPHVFDLPLIGASGGVYGILLACAVYYPHVQLIFLFFPVPIRLASIIIFAGMILTVLAGLVRREVSFTGQFWSDVAHFGGAVAAAVWIWVVPRLRGATRQARAKVDRGAWQRKMQKRAKEEAEMDRILRKIHEEGVGSLTQKEKKLLQDATRRQRQAERDLYRL